MECENCNREVGKCYYCDKKFNNQSLDVICFKPESPPNKHFCSINCLLKSGEIIISKLI